MPFYILPFKPFSASFCPLVSDAVVNLRAKRTTPFSFHLSPFPLTIMAARWTAIVVSIAPFR